MGAGPAVFWPLVEASGDTFSGALFAREDGGAWLVVDSKTVALVSKSGSLKRIPLEGAGIEIRGTVAATGPDGRLWLMVSDTGRMVVVDEHGEVESRDVALPPGDDDDTCALGAMAIESEGAFWLSDYGCGRLIRVLDGEGEVYAVLPDEPDKAVFPTAMVWTPDDRLIFINHSIDRPPLAEVTVDHTVTPISLGADDISARAVFPDGKGSAWVTISDACSAAHVVGGATQAIRTPFPPSVIAPAGSGELWAAGATRIERIPVTGAGNVADCDVSDPTLELASFGGDMLSLDRLKRDGIVVDVGEPSIVFVDFVFSDDGQPGNFGTIDETRVVTEPGQLKLEVPAEFIRRAREHLSEGKRPMLVSGTMARDSSGNEGYGEDGPAESVRLTD